MQPIVNGIKKQYRACLKMERVNFNSKTRWHELIGPIGSPEFVLLDSSNQIIYRWIGLTEKEEFTQVMNSVCGS
jgi:hypothetical protein